VARWYKIDYLYVLIILTLTTPYRTVLGNGQVGITVLLILILLLNIDKIQGKIQQNSIWFIGTAIILTIKPYLLIGLFLMLFFKRNLGKLVITMMVYVSVSLLVPYKSSLFLIYINSLLMRGQNSHMDRDNFSITAAFGNFLDLEILGLIFGLVIVLALSTLFLKRDQNYSHFLVLLIPVVASSYVHSQDLILISIATLLLPKVYEGISNLTSIQLGIFVMFCVAFSNVGLIVLFFVALILVLLVPNKMIFSSVFLSIIISMGANYYQRIGELTVAYNLYGIPYLLVLIYLPVLVLVKLVQNRVKKN
jgi:hypothetical protein